MGKWENKIKFKENRGNFIPAGETIKVWAHMIWAGYAFKTNNGKSRLRKITNYKKTK